MGEAGSGSVNGDGCLLRVGNYFTVLSLPSFLFQKGWSNPDVYFQPV